MKNLSKFSVLLIPFLFFLLSINGPARSEIIDRTAAVINDKVITLSELHKAMIEMAPSLGSKSEKKAELLADKSLEKKTLDHMINEILIEDEIKKRGLEVTDSELDMFVKNIMRQNGLKTTAELDSALALQGLNPAEYRKSIKKQLERSKIMNYAIRAKVDISEQDLKNYYAQHTEEAREPDSVHLRNIFVKKDPKNEAKKKAKIKSVLDSLVKGEKFESMVKKYSEDSNAKTGGDLGFLTGKDINPKIYSEVTKLKVGRHTGVIDTEAGYYIIKLSETKKGEIRSFEDVKDEFKNRLAAKEMENKFTNWLAEIRSQSYIDVKI